MYKLVIADDEQFIRKHLEKSLDWQQYGFEIVGSFPDGSDVIGFLSSNYTDVILSDIRMKKVSGLEVAKYVYENNLDTKVILLSGYEEFDYARTALKYQVFDYLIKPSTHSDLNNIFVKMKKTLDEINKTNPVNIDMIIDDILELINKNNCSGAISIVESISANYTENLTEIVKCLKQRINYEEDLDIETTDTESAKNSMLKLICHAENRSKHQVIYDALDYIKENYANEITLEEVAAKVGMNANYFSRYFKANVGQKFIDYLTDLRLSKAKKMLELTDVKISDISEVAGYKNLKHFYKIFKFHTNYTPKEYRSMMKGITNEK